MTLQRSFRALLEPDGTRLRWTIARIPFDIKKAWPQRRGRRVRGTVNGAPIRTSLFPDPVGEGHVLLVSRKMQTAIGVRRGDPVTIALEPDMEEREAMVPEELQRALKEVPGLRRWYGGLNPARRRDIGKWVSEPKSTASRTKRAEQIAERLALTMDGERETPPILRAAFQRQPLAEAGWNALTPVQRRNHLIGIFYYRTAEAREKRAQEAIADALKAAKRSGNRSKV
ncbi:MAG TPA: YdeI/OmpD-associated family protein [Terracidiphilus sp.]|nr:YdeI/OmpD-associated family protein [Terracidiphilus sp.]